MDTATILSGVITILALLLIRSQFKKFKYWSSLGIKGPTPWPCLGTSAKMLTKNKVDVDLEWFAKYGKTYGTYEGSSPLLRTCDNAIIKQVLIKDFSSFTQRNRANVFGSVSKWLFFTGGEHWSNQRALITPMFTSSRMKLMFNVVYDSINRLMKEFDSRLKTANGHQDDDGTFCKDELMSMGLDMIAQSFFSLKFDTYRDKTSQFYKRAYAWATFDVPHFMMWLFTPRAIVKYMQINPFPASKFEYFEKLSQTMINERRNPNHDGGKKKNDILQALLDARIPDHHEIVFNEEDDADSHYNDKIKHAELDEIHQSQTKAVKFRMFEDDEIRAQMIFFFLAGFETTASSIVACILSLAHHQADQQLVYEEIKSKCPDGPKVFSDLTELNYLDAAISESLRLFPPVSELRRMVTAKGGVDLASTPPIHLSEGQSVSIPVYVVHHDPEYWPEPDKFDMSRFYPENKNQIKSCSYMPFGVGPRNCVGMRFALMAMKLCLSKLLLDYRIVASPKSTRFPPEFSRHALFVQIKHTDFRLEPRKLASRS